MSDPYLDYWVESVVCSLDSAGIQATADQIKAIAKDIKISHDYYGEAFGHHEADIACKARITKETKMEVVREVRSLCDQMGEDSRFVDHMRYDQKMALAKVFNLEEHLKSGGKL